MKRKKVYMGILLNVITVIISLIFLIPLLVVFLNSFKNKAESNTMTLHLPNEWVFENFQVVIERGKLIQSFFNSFFYAVAGSLLIVLLISAAGFVLARNRSRINRFLYYFLILGIAMPINNVTLMKVMKLTHLINTRMGMILIYAAINIPISLFIIYGFVGNIPVEIDEAAIIDGCDAKNLLVRIGFPLLKNGQ